MPAPVKLSVLESVSTLRFLLVKAPIHQRARLEMLLHIVRDDIHLNTVLAAKTGAGQRSILRWKQTYAAAGIDGLLSDARGGDFRSGIDAAGKKKIEDKLSGPKGAFTSFGQAQAWINKELGTDKKYHAINKYLKRNFGAKLKVGRKSHVKKDEAAVAVFKKTDDTPKTH